MALQQSPIHLAEFIDRQSISPFQIGIVALCFLIVAIDGIDTAAIGFLSPAILAEWHLAPAQLAPIFGAGLAGLMAGAFTFGPLSDRVGRKPVLIFCVLCFGLGTIACAFAGSLWTLVALRFLTGLGLGGAMPNAITLTSEYCPERRRSFLVTTMFCGFTIGSALGGLAAASLSEQYGWRTALTIGGVLPLLLVPILAWKLPESVRFLTLNSRNPSLVRKTLTKIARGVEIPSNARFITDARPAGSPVASLFRPNLVRGTLMLWLNFFMSLLVIYMLTSWLPVLLRTSGASLKTAALVTMMFQIGGTTGAIILGWLMDRFTPHYVLALSYTLAGAFIAVMGHLTTLPWLAGAAVFAAGFCVSGSQVGGYALSAAYYPTDCRATGVSWANAVGRLGSMLGATGGGALIAMGVSMPALFVLVAIPSVIAGIAIFGFGRSQLNSKSAAAVTAAK